MLERIRRVPWLGDLFAIIFLIAWPLVYYWPVTIGQKVFSEGDLLWFFLPARTELARSIAEGRLPLWTPSLQAGFPLFAEGQVAALYPINILFHRLLPPESAISYTILFNLAWAAIGMYLFTRSSGFRISSSLLGGFIFGASGFMTAHIPHASLLAVATWLPWLLLFQSKYWQAKKIGERTFVWFLLITISIGLQLLGGYPPIALLNLAAFIWFGITTPRLFATQAGMPLRNRFVTYLKHFPVVARMVILPIVLGIGIAAIQLLPLAEFAGLSARGQEVGKAFFTSYSLEPLALTQFVGPFWYLGQPDAGNMEFWGYLGVLPLILALAALFLRRDIRTLSFLALGLIAVFLALGRSNPIYEWLYYIPVFNRFRAPARFLFLFTFSAAFLAATSFEELQNRLPALSRGNRRFLGIGSAFAVLISGVIALSYNQPSEFWMEAWKFIPAFLVLFSLVAISLMLLRSEPQSSFSTVVIGFTLLDYALFSAPFLTNITGMTGTAELAQTPRTVRAMDSQYSVYRVFVNRFPSVTPAAVRATLWPNLSLQYGKQGVGVYAPLEFQRNKEYVQSMSLPMWNLMNIRYYLLPLETAPPGNPSPFDETEPNGGLTMGLLSQQPSIAPTRVASVEIVSYTDQSSGLPDGSLAGELTLTSDGGKTITLPIRVGIETADWAYDGISQIGEVNHSKPSNSQTFPAYLASVGREFQGRKYVARYNLDTSITATAMGVQSLLADNGLKVESVSLIDEQSHSVSLAALLHRNELALAFRSHTAAMWENKSVMPRAFIVHAAEVSSDSQTLARMQQPDFRPDETLLLDEPLPLSESNAVPQEKPNDQVQITEYQPERVVIDVKAGAPGYLVLTDSWYPGWMATIDGKDAPIVRADYIFRALAMPAGQHTVVFEYKPMSLVWGAVISALSVLVCIGLAVAAYFRSARLSKPNLPLNQVVDS